VNGNDGCPYGGNQDLDEGESVVSTIVISVAISSSNEKDRNDSGIDNEVNVEASTKSIFVVDLDGMDGKTNSPKCQEEDAPWVVSSPQVSKNEEAIQCGEPSGVVVEAGLWFRSLKVGSDVFGGH